MKKLEFFVLAVVLFFTTFAYAQIQDGLEVRVRTLTMNLSGLDEHMADKYEFYITTGRKDPAPEDPGYFNVDYGTSYDPIILSMSEQTRLSLDLIYRGSRWGIEARTWNYGARVSKNGIVTTPGPKHNEDGSITNFVTGIRMWGNTKYPVIHEGEASGRSPVRWWAENDFNVWTSEALFLFRGTEYFETIFGLKKTEINHKQKLGRKQHAFLDNYQGYDLNNDITLSQTANVDYGLIGPVFGLRAQSKHFEIFITQSMLFGKVGNFGLWTDIDDGIWTFHDSGEIYSTIYYDGEFPFYKKTRATVPHTELNLRYYNYGINLGKISVGYELGLFAQVFVNAPMAPKWELPGSWTWAQGTNWSTQTENLIFTGFSASLIFQF